MNRPRRRAALAALLALLPPALPATAWGRPRAQTHAQVVHPALWRVRKGDATLYLFGTIHALPPHFEWETPAIRAVIDHADRLVIEAVIDPDPAKTGAALYRLGMATKPIAPLADRVGPQYRAALSALIRKTAIPPATFDGLKTWAAGMVLFGTSVQTLGVTSADGVEERLKAEFRAAGKPIEGLETLDEQLGFFDTMTEPQQREFLEGVVDEKADDAADFGKMLGAWSHGDERGIGASFDRDMGRSDALRAVLIARRNAHWADALVKRLDRPGTQLVAVGAGHLVGPDSLQARLAALGYKAVRVE